MKDQLNDANDKLVEIEDLKRKVNSLNNDNYVLTNDKEDLKREVDDLKDKIRRLEEQLEEADRKLRSQKKTPPPKGLDRTRLNVESNKQIKKIKGDIIHSREELQFITRKINKLNKRITLTLKYKASEDGDGAADFHAKCDKLQSSLVLVESTNGRRFGGFTSKDWSGNGEEKNDENAFVFSLIEGPNGECEGKIYSIIPGEKAIGCYPRYGPVFLGCQIRIYDGALKKTYGGSTFEKGLNYNTEENFELAGEQNFGVRDIEVYEVKTE